MECPVRLPDESTNVFDVKRFRQTLAMRGAPMAVVL
jgi:hypothetical protein